MPPAFWKPSDKHIVARVLRGNRDAFGELVERYLTRVHAVTYARTGNRADAEEAAQEAFLQAFTSLDRLSDPSRFGPWLLTIARRTASTHGRRMRRDTVRANEIPVPDPPFDIANVQQREIHGLLHEELARLEDMQREILLLYYFGGRNTRETAQFLGVSVAAAKKRLQRARDALGTALVDRLGDALEVERPGVKRKAGIMAAIATAPVAWKTAQAATGGITAILLSPKALVAGAVAIIAGAVVVTTTILQAPSGNEADTTTTVASQVTEEPETPSASVQDATTPPDGSATPTEESPRELKPHECLLKGRVVHADTGEGIPNVRVKSKRREPFSLEATTDKTGAFEAVVCRGDSVPVALDDVKLAFVSLNEAIRVPKDVDEFEVVLKVAPGAFVSGRVFDVEDKEDLPDVKLTLKSGGYQDQGCTITKTDGTFSFGPLPPGKYQIEAKAPRHFSDNQQAAWAKLSRGQHFDGLQIPLREGIRVAGSLVEDGVSRTTPATVMLLVREKDGVKSRQYRDRTGRDGVFSMVAPKIATATAVLWVTDSDTLTSALQGPYAFGRDNMEHLTIPLVECASVEGSVVDPNGQPMEGVMVVLFAREPLPDPVFRFGLGFQTNTTSRNDGVFRIQGIPPGEYWIFTATQGGSYPDPEYRETITLQLGQKVENRVLRCLGAGSLSIIGTVLDPHGQPEKGARVLVYGAESNGSDRRSVFADEHGRFAVQGLQQGVYKVGASGGPDSSEYLSAVQQTVRAGNSVTLNLRAGAEVGLTVLDAQTGDPVIAYSASLMYEGSGHGVGVGDGEGTRILKQANPGENTLRVEAEGYRAHEETIIVRQGTAEVNPVTVRLDRAEALRGVVLSPSGEPVAGAVVLPHDLAAENALGSAGQPKAITDANGRFSLSLDAQKYPTLWAYHRDFWKASAPAVAGQDIAIVLQASGRIEGRVTHDGEPVQEFSVDIRGLHVSKSASSVPGGFVVAPVPPGVHEVTVTPAVLSEDGRTQSYSTANRAAQLVEVAAGQTTVVDFSFSDKTGVIEGRVTVNGAPANGGSVGCRMRTPAGEQQGGNAQLGADGHYRIENLPPGTASVYVRLGKGELQGMRIERVEGVEVRADRTTRKNIDVRGTCTIAVRATGAPDGVPAVQYVLFAGTEPPTWGRGEEERMVALQGGTSDAEVRLEGVSAGEYLLYARALQHTQGTLSTYWGATPVTLRDGQTVSVTVALDHVEKQTMGHP